MLLDAASNIVSAQKEKEYKMKRKRISRSIMTNENDISSDSLPSLPSGDGLLDEGRDLNGKGSVTVETAVFVDETLYEIMKKTFPGMSVLVSYLLLYDKQWLP